MKQCFMRLGGHQLYDPGGRGHSGILLRMECEHGKEAVFQVQPALEAKKKELRHIWDQGLPGLLLRSHKKSN